MILYIRSLFPSQVITLPVMTQSPQRMVIRVCHDSKPNTVYFETCPIIDGKIVYTINIPKSPRALILEVYNEANGNRDPDNTYRVGKISVNKLNPPLNAKGIMNDTAYKFAQFSDWFAENARVLPAQNSIYRSPDGKFRIDYKDVIRDDEGNELTTPARINGTTGIIEISRKYYINFTVPGRKAINWHEFSHVYKNENPADEFEADKNAISMYLYTGNPKLDAIHVFLKTFKNTASDLNKRRYQELDNYIRDFENLQEKEKQAA